jgi:hypothetical protein
MVTDLTWDGGPRDLASPSTADPMSGEFVVDLAAGVASSRLRDMRRLWIAPVARGRWHLPRQEARRGDRASASTQPFAAGCSAHRVSPQVRYRITSHFGESTAGGADHARSRRSRPGARSVLRKRDATGKIAARRREPWQAPERRRSGALGRAGCPGVHPGTHAWPTGWGARSDLDVRLHAEVPAGDRGESPSVRQGRRRSRAAVATARIAQRLRDHPR